MHPNNNSYASYDNHFIIKQLAKESKGELNCIGESM